MRQERRRQSPKPREAKPEGPRGGTRPSEASSGLVSWIAGLPSEISWRVPIAVAAILLLGWVLPGQVFTLQGSVGWGVWSLLYAVAGVIVTGVIFILRRRVLGGTELALYWFALVSFLACAGVSMGTWLGSAGTINADLLMSGIAIVTAAALIFLRRAKIGGLEFAVYWFGLALVLFWGPYPSWRSRSLHRRSGPISTTSMAIGRPESCFRVSSSSRPWRFFSCEGRS